jgi:hypothetical protein
MDLSYPASLLVEKIRVTVEHLSLSHQVETVIIFSKVRRIIVILTQVIGLPGFATEI